MDEYIKRKAAIEGAKTADLVCGWKFGMTAWGIGLALALIIVTAMYLIEEG